MDDSRFTAVRFLSRTTGAALAKARCRPRRLKVVGSAAAGAVLVVGLAAGCGSGGGGSGGGSASSPITICEIAASTGPFATLGGNDELGATAWAKLVNSHGGVQGHQVKLVPENDASDPATAAGLVRKCVTQDHANFIFGPESTGTAAAAIPIANQLQTVLLGWQSGWNGQGISDANLHGYAFPAIGNVYYADDLATVTQLIAPKHYTKVAVIEDNSPGGLGNTEYTAGLGPKYGFKVVASQIVNPGSTDDTPQVLKLLAAKPDIIVLGLTPGPDTITFIKSVRAQNPTIPISECSGCATSNFIDAVGGASAMKNVYLIGSPANFLTAVSPSPDTQPGIDDTKAYIAAMKADGMTTNQVNSGSEGWAAGKELEDAITQAKSTKASDVKNALQHQKITTGGIVAYYWARTPQDHSTVSKIDSAVVTVAPDGSFKVLPHIGS
jgi:ABC-type branched-subunit amino acid transport system substrate-binding protein